MKINRIITIYALVILTFGCCLSPHSKNRNEQTIHPSPNNGNSYFISVPITKLSSIQSPCVDVNIGDKLFSMELDLGFRGDLSLQSRFINQISPKTFIKTKPMYGIRGKKHLNNLYQIPKVKIGGMAFFESVLQEDSAEFVKNSVFVKNGGEPSAREPGRLGWEFFHATNLLIDIQNSTIAFCDSLDTLKQQGYPIEEFIDAPLHIEQGLVECIADTPEGPLRCMLDTGCTLNMLNSDIEEEKIARAFWDPEYDIDYAYFKIKNIDFGPQKFHRFPITLPIRIDAILGMDFFEEHLVFIDFSNEKIYFSKDHPMMMTTNDDY